MATERTFEQWLELFEQGPEEENECRACFHTMTPHPADATEPTAFCHSCAQEFLELLVEAYKDMKKLARRGWVTVESLAIAGGHKASEKAADKALEELGDGN